MKLLHIGQLRGQRLDEAIGDCSNAFIRSDDFKRQHRDVFLLGKRPPLPYEPERGQQSDRENPGAEQPAARPLHRHRHRNRAPIRLRARRPLNAPKLIRHLPRALPSAPRIFRQMEEALSA